jgi:hypothetical protein
MNMHHVFRLLCSFALCLALAAPALALDASPRLASGQSKKVASASHTDIQAKLDAFAKKTVASINRCVMPSKAKKEIKPGSGGGYMARYVEIDPRSVRTSFKVSSSSVVSHIGYLNYDEVEYICTGANAKAAASAPCSPIRRQRMTELVKFVNGQWTY